MSRWKQLPRFSTQDDRVWRNQNKPSPSSQSVAEEDPHKNSTRPEWQQDLSRAIADELNSTIFHRQVFFHGPRCLDGFAAALVAWTKFGDRSTTYHPISHRHQTEVVAGVVPGAEVYFLDICFDLATMEAVRAVASSLKVLDHHASAAEEIGDKRPWATFDRFSSGCTMAWRFFFADDTARTWKKRQKVPRLLSIVEDYDLYRFRFRETADLAAYLDRLPREFVAWRRALLHVEHPKGAKFREMLEFGKFARNQAEEAVANLCLARAAFALGEISGYAAQGPSSLASEAGHRLAVLAQKELLGNVGCVWNHAPDGHIKVSVRACDDLASLHLWVKTVPFAKLAGGNPSSAAFSVEPADHSRFYACLRFPSHLQ